MAMEDASSADPLQGSDSNPGFDGSSLPADMLAVDEALTEFEAVDPEAAELVKLRFFAGFSQEESAAALEIPRRTADRRWAYARAWLHDRLSSGT